jgi:hypothetical protein
MQVVILAMMSAQPDAVTGNLLGFSFQRCHESAIDLGDWLIRIQHFAVYLFCAP